MGFGSHLAQELLGGFAVRAVGFAEDSCDIISIGTLHGCESNLPTAFSSIIDWALVFAADMAAGLARVPKRRRRKEILGECSNIECVVSSGLLRGLVEDCHDALYVVSELLEASRALFE